MDNAKGYKAFKPGMICRDKQYAENTDYEEVGGKICEKGMMHYCVNPFDVLNFYNLVDESGKFSDFAEVKALDQPISGPDGKFATKKLHIGAKLSFAGFIKACIDYTKEQTIVNMPKSDVATGYSAQIGSSGDYAQIGSWATTPRSAARATTPRSAARATAPRSAARATPPRSAARATPPRSAARATLPRSAARATPPRSIVPASTP